jgi:hypothetical protein
VIKDGDKFGLADMSGKVQVKPQYKALLPPMEGLAVACLDDKFGYIDVAGKQVIPPSFAQAEPFSEGLAGVAVVVSPDAAPVADGNHK